MLDELISHQVHVTFSDRYVPENRVQRQTIGELVHADSGWIQVDQVHYPTITVRSVEHWETCKHAQ